jgi:phage gpG-like protein
MSKFKFREKAVRFRSRKSAILEKMANNAVTFFKVDTFDKRSFNGVPWKPNKEQTGSQQLVKTGRMRQSITILSRSSDSITVGSAVPYAVYHNEGTKHLPQRKFIGKNKTLEAKNKKLLLQEVGKIV